MILNSSKFFKNFDFEYFFPISTSLILIFSWNFKILDLDIEAKKPFLPISGLLQVKVPGIQAQSCPPQVHVTSV